MDYEKNEKERKKLASTKCLSSFVWYLLIYCMRCFVQNWAIRLNIMCAPAPFLLSFSQRGHVYASLCLWGHHSWTVCQLYVETYIWRIQEFANFTSYSWKMPIETLLLQATGSIAKLKFFAFQIISGKNACNSKSILCSNVFIYVYEFR